MFLYRYSSELLRRGNLIAEGMVKTIAVGSTSDRGRHSPLVIILSVKFFVVDQLVFGIVAAPTGGGWLRLTPGKRTGRTEIIENDARTSRISSFGLGRQKHNEISPY